MSLCHFLPVLLACLAGCGAGPDGPTGAAPAPLAGAANPLVGTRIDLAGVRWLDPDGTAPDLAQSRLTLLRWWTVQCPFCRDSLPDLAELHRRFSPRGLGMVGVFHPKMRRGPTDAETVDYARELGFPGAVAADDRWVALNRLRQRGGLDEATSISVLVDGAGVVQWVHPGPRLHRSRGEFPEADAAFVELERLLGERLPK